MPNKLQIGSLPAGHTRDDFQCFGPPAVSDGEFDACKIADMGSFSQDDKDSNKFYHAAVVKSRKDGRWYVYCEWGRVGAKVPQFQFTECLDETEAQRAFASQCHEKNDRRGVWSTVAGIRTLTAKPGKDVYLVRQLTTRSTGLPDAKTIKYVDPAAPAKPAPVRSASKAMRKTADSHTAKLLRDLVGGTVAYTRSAMADNSLPTATAIDQGRTILIEAQKRVAALGDDLKSQVADADLRTLSAEMYRRIPKVKAVGTPDDVWILSGNNIVSWRHDLDAFESALSGEVAQEEDSSDPFHGLPLHMEWIDPKSDLGRFLMFWWPKATGNRHGGIGAMKIKNLWRVDRHGDDEKFGKRQDRIAKDYSAKFAEQPLFQPSERSDVAADRRDTFERSNTALLFHGTRSVNVRGILEKSLLLPKQLVGVATNGAMFGPLLYWADDWKKSAGYTSLKGSYWASGGGSVSGRSAFMFAADVAVGKAFVAPGCHGYTAAPKGHHSIFGKGRHHGKGPHSGVENNEWIIPETDQFRLKYLAEFEA